jgi:hypothetical protein
MAWSSHVLIPMTSLRFSDKTVTSRCPSWVTYAYFQAENRFDRRSVTPEVAGSSPVAPVHKLPAMQAVFV